MHKLAQFMRVYQHHHQKPITKLTHFIGVPLIIFSLQILGSCLFLPWVPISLTWLITGALIIYYFTLHIPLAGATALVMLVMAYFAGWLVNYQFNILTWCWFLSLFSIGWVLQLVGHYYEGNRPALMESLGQVLVAPIFLMSELFFYLGYTSKQI